MGVYIGLLRVRIGPVCGIKVRISDLRLKLEFTGKDTWETAIDKIREAGKKGVIKSHKAAIGLIEKCIKPPGYFKKLPLGIVEKLINIINFQVDERYPCQVTLMCGEMPLVISAAATVRTSKYWGFQIGGTQARITAQLGVKVLPKDAEAVQLLYPVDLDVVAKLPCILRTVLVPIPAEQAKKKVDLKVNVKHLPLFVSPAIIAKLLNASQAFAQFKDWKEPYATEAQHSLTNLSATEMTAYTEALKKKAKVAEYEDKMFLADILEVRRRVEDWPVDPDLTFNEWLSLKKVEMSPVHHVTLEFGLDKSKFEIIDDDLPEGQGILVHMNGVKVGGTTKEEKTTVDILSALRHPDDFPIGDKVIRATVSASLGRFFVLCDPEDSFSMPVLDPLAISIKAVLFPEASQPVMDKRTRMFRMASNKSMDSGSAALQRKLNSVKLEFTLEGLDELAAVLSRHTGFGRLWHREGRIRESQLKPDDDADAKMVRLTLAPRAIW